MFSIATFRRTMPVAGAALAVLIFSIALAPAGAAQAAAGTFEWCPGSLPHDDAGCFTATSVQDAVNQAQAAKKPGTIYINSTTTTENVVAARLNGVSILGNADNGAGTTIDGTVQILNSRNITFAQLTVTGMLTVDHASGWLTIGDTHGPSVVVSNSTFSKSTGIGLQIADFSGTTLVSRVTATGNSGDGIQINSGAPVTLTDVNATNNGGKGLSINNNGGVVLSAASTRINHFDRNTGDGISIQTDAPVPMTDVSASRNGGDGVAITNNAGATLTTARSAMNHFDRNGGNGVAITTSAPATLTDISASMNTLDGLLINASGGMNIGTVRARMNHFDRNGGYGMGLSSGAPITLTDVSASRNTSDGANVAISTASMTIQSNRSKMNHFDHNGGYGIHEVAGAPGTVNDVSVSQNGLDGMSLTQAGGSTIETSQSTLMHFDGNKGTGIVISTDGPISLKDISASRNLVNGATLLNQGGVTLALLNGRKNYFDRNGQDGINIETAAPVTLVLLSASLNTHAGIVVTNFTNNAPATVGCAVVRSNTVFDIIDTLAGGTLYLNGVTLTHTDTSTVSNTGGTVTVNSSCS